MLENKKNPYFSCGERVKIILQTLKIFYLKIKSKYVFWNCKKKIF